MKCYACGSDRMDNTVSQCPDCGFSNMGVAGDDGEFQDVLRKMAADYRENKIGGSRLSFMTYQYALKDDHLVLDHEEEYELSMDVAGMELRQIWWDSTNIARIDAGEPMDLSLAIKRAGQERREKREGLRESAWWDRVLAYRHQVLSWVQVHSSGGKQQGVCGDRADNAVIVAL